MTAAAILLAAGESTRMGTPKPLLPWNDATLIEYHVRELAAAGVDDIVVVLGHVADEVRPRVPPEARVVVNEAYRDGRASSLRAGAAALSEDADPILVLNVDQPRPRDVLRSLLAAHRDGGALVTLPVAEGRRGHPPVLARPLLPELRSASEEAQGLRGVIGAHQKAIREADLSAPVVLLDINTPEDYRRALARFGMAPRPS
jgi:molybdenum cofactor cytidylyltransferase